MKPVIISGDLRDSKIVTNESIQSISRMIEDGDVVIIRGVFDCKLILAIKSEVFIFGQGVSEQNHESTANVVNFHRIDDNHPAMAVKRIAHFFRYSYVNSAKTSIFNVIHPLNILRNELAGLPENYTFYNDDSGYLSQPAVLHYPCGGGYMQAHVDPLEPQKVEMVCSFSERGENFETGGLSIYTDRQWHDVEQYIRLGDICMFRPDIPHRVEAIDPHKDKKFNDSDGRWTVFSPIASVVDKSQNEAAVQKTEEL
jgi:hypothetical protein